MRSRASDPGGCVLLILRRYDSTGRTTESEGMFDDAAAMGSWEAYFEAVYQRVDKKMLDEDKKLYQGESPRLPSRRLG